MSNQSVKIGLLRSKPNFFLAVMLIFFLAGCAEKPWSGKLKENEVKSYKDMIGKQIKAHSTCPSTLDAEVTVTWKTALETKAFSGYLQMKLPSSVKFVTTNPLGQTLFALVSDGKDYNSVNAITQQYISGSLFSLALRNNIPAQLLAGNWATWLSGRIVAADKEKVVDIRKDLSGMGLWVIAKNPKDATGNKDYILVDSTGSRPLLRVLMNGDDAPIARIKYSDWQQRSKCELPTTFDITGLPMGTEIKVHLSDIITDKVFGKQNFILMPPRGYFIQFLP